MVRVKKKELVTNAHLPHDGELKGFIRILSASPEDQNKAEWQMDEAGKKEFANTLLRRTQVLFGFRRNDLAIPIAKKIGNLIFPISSTLDSIEEVEYVAKTYTVIAQLMKEVEAGETDMAAALRAAIAEAVEKHEGKDVVYEITINEVKE